MASSGPATTDPGSTGLSTLRAEVGEERAQQGSNNGDAHAQARPSVVWVTVENSNGEITINHYDKNPNESNQITINNYDKNPNESSQEKQYFSPYVPACKSRDNVNMVNTNGTVEKENVEQRDIIVIQPREYVEIKQEPVEEVLVEEEHVQSTNVQDGKETAVAFVPPIAKAVSQLSATSIKTENVETGESKIYMQQDSAEVQVTSQSQIPRAVEAQMYAVQPAGSFNTLNTVVVDSAELQQNQTSMAQPTQQHILCENTSTVQPAQPVHMVINNNALPSDVQRHEIAVVVIDNTGDHDNIQEEYQVITVGEEDKTKWSEVNPAGDGTSNDSFSFLNVQNEPSENMGLQTIIVEPVSGETTKHMSVGHIQGMKCPQPKLQPKRHPRSKKPRRIISLINNQKTITADAMKNQVRDTSDIIARMNVAPPTKKIMKLQETTVKNLLTSPGRPIGSRELDEFYREHLVTKPVPLEEVFAPSDDLVLPSPGLEEEHNYTNEGP